MIRNQAHSESFSAAHLFQLDEQTLFSIERADSYRVEGLHIAPRLINSLYRPAAHHCYLFKSRIEITVIVEIAYYCLCRLAILSGKIGEAQLPEEVFGESERARQKVLI